MRSISQSGNYFKWSVLNRSIEDGHIVFSVVPLQHEMSEVSHLLTPPLFLGKNQTKRYWADVWQALSSVGLASVLSYLFAVYSLVVTLTG